MPRRVYRERGSVFPFVAFSLVVVLAYVGFATDVMRNFLAVEKLQFAADAAACYGYSLASNPDGSYTPASAQANMAQAVMEAGGADASAWNSAPSGPASSQAPWSTGVGFSEADIAFASNPDPLDAGEVFLQVTARRQGDDALKQLFMPALYALSSLAGQPAPPGIFQVQPYRVSEVVGQPASRIGPGAPRTGATSARAAALSGFAALPIAISNRQFQAAADPSETRGVYTVDLFDSRSPQFIQPALPGHFKGCFVNVAASGGGANYYGDSQGNPAIDQLVGTLKYFFLTAEPLALPPASVERGSMLGAFDQGDPVFAQRKSAVLASLRQLPVGRYFIVPVLRNDPALSFANEVVGFARLRLVQAVNSDGSDFALAFAPGESVPVRNASHANGRPGIANQTASTMPAPVAPFADRQYQAAANSLSPRPRGIALSPALSPRKLSPL